MAMTKVSEVTVGSGGAASIEFTGIPATGKDLLILLSTRESGGNLSAFLKPNSSSSNLSARFLSGSGSSTESDTQNSVISFLSTISSDTASTFGNASIYISNYAGSSAKSFSLDFVTENNATTAFQRIAAGLWNSSSTITSFKIDASDGFVQHSTASLYIIS
jgi:hypothetical protein